MIRGGFASQVWPEEAVNRSFRDIEADIVYGLEVTIDFNHSIEKQNRFRHQSEPRK